MANEITVQISLSYNNPAAGINIPTQTLAQGPTQFSITGKNFASGSMSVPTTAGGTAVPVSNLANVGWYAFVNRDATNYCTLMTAVSGSNLARLVPVSGMALGYFDPGVTAPALLAHTAVTVVEYLILEI